MTDKTALTIGVVGAVVLVLHNLPTLVIAGAIVSIAMWAERGGWRAP